MVWKILNMKWKYNVKMKKEIIDLSAFFAKSTLLSKIFPLLCLRFDRFKIDHKIIQQRDHKSDSSLLANKRNLENIFRWFTSNTLYVSVQFPGDEESIEILADTWTTLRLDACSNSS